MEIKHGLEIHVYNEAGYKPLVDYESWRVAMLNSTDVYRAENIKTMQRHNETDEVFVLLAGKCVLFIASCEDEPDDLHGELLEPLKVYNVPKAYWHTHVLEEGAHVLVVENKETTHANSPHIPISDEMQQKIIEISERVLT